MTRGNSGSRSIDVSLLHRGFRRLGRLLEPLLAPDAAAQRERVERLIELARQQRDALKALGSLTATQASELQHLKLARSVEVAVTQERFTELRAGVRRQASALARLARRAGIESEFEIAEQRVLDRLDRLRRSGQPIVIGPWTGEIGFELLYWIPFVRWAVDKFQLPADRLTIVSRGGTAGWYSGIRAQYVDVFSLATPDEFRTRTAATKKQRFMGAYDRELLRRVRGRLGGGAVSLLHPAMMYALFMPFWKRQAPPSRVLDHVTYRKVDTLKPAGLPDLPRDYVAVRFYFSDCFPDTPANREFVDRVVATISERADVVMLNPGFRVDDHVDWGAGMRARIHTVDMSGRPEENLAWQTAIIAGARAFVGTYGGFSYLAPMCGVHAIAFYSDRTYFTYHLELAQQAFAASGGGVLDAIDVASVEHLSDVIGRRVPAGR